MEKAKNFYRKYLHNSFFFCLVWAFLMNLAIETLARKGMGGFVFLFESPVVFLYNTLIIFAMLAIATVFRRRVFFIVIVTLVWMGVGITNGVILIQRMTPFTVKDLSAITDGATLLTNYFSTTEIALIAGGIVIGVIALIILFIKAPKKPKGEVKLKRNIAAVLLVIAMPFFPSLERNQCLRIFTITFQLHDPSHGQYFVYFLYAKLFLVYTESLFNLHTEKYKYEHSEKCNCQQGFF